MEDKPKLMTRDEYNALQASQNKPQSEQPPQWMAQLDERTNKHIAFARTYAAQFGHGAPGHLDLMTIAALAKLLDEREPHEDG